MALSSPGVEVKVIDESFYTPAAPGTVPLIMVASAENKLASSGVAVGTLKANAGKVYLLTSQRDLVETFGDPVFRTDSNNNPIHAGELNEYGLQAAYSLLGVSNRAFVVRADVDLNELVPSAVPPASTPASGTHWFDTRGSNFGIFEWNGERSSVRGGQTFKNVVPIVITDPDKIENSRPKAAIGKNGDYAVDTTNTDNVVYYKNRDGQWVIVGSSEWLASWPVVYGEIVTASIVNQTSIILNSVSISIDIGDVLGDIAQKINNVEIPNVTAAVVNDKLELYCASGDALNVAFNDSYISDFLGISSGIYYAPKLQISKHTIIPEFKRKDITPRPTGSVWVKSTEPNLGARWRIKRYNGATGLWVDIDAPIFDNARVANNELDRSGGGVNIPLGAIYVKSNVNEVSPAYAEFKIMRRAAAGPTVIRSNKNTADLSGMHSLMIAETTPGTSDTQESAIFEFVALNTADAKTQLINAINTSSRLKNVVAELDTQGRVVITHRQGGEIMFNDNIRPFGFDFNSTTHFYELPVDTSADFTCTASNWEPLNYIASDDAPTSLTEDGTLWYSSIIDEVDIMIHDGSKWVGYRTPESPVNVGRSDDNELTDPDGPIIAASVPLEQSDGSKLVTGDIWVDTSDLENFPKIYKFNADIENTPIAERWVLIDTTDQSTEDGILFADARSGSSGGVSDGVNVVAPDGLISELLYTNYVDPDAPDPALYPKGMLLWNLRRSGFNVKRFSRNYIDRNTDNIRHLNESMEVFYPHRWTTVSSNQENGSGTFGRKAQRKVVVQALQAMVNSNQDIRDEEGRVFNLMACPGYPELIGEMISLNYDRGLTAFVVADTPARLTPDATSLLSWGTNEKLAAEDNDIGAVSFDEYMGMFYPWGYTSDNYGNNVIVPPSHMILRTIAINDQIAYPWFAPAGIRRGGITNATSVGFVDSEGEFKTVALNNGQRDTLYESKINPITFFTGTGLVNYGQKTRAKGASALDRINVARLVIYLRRQLAIMSKPYIFEPNDKVTRDELKAQIESLMLELVAQRAIYDYLVIADESNNFASRIDRNELWVDIAIEPVKSVEFIYLPLRLKNTGEIKGG